MWGRVGLILRFKLRVALRTYLNPANVFLMLLSVAGLWVLTRRLVAAALEAELAASSLPTLWFTGLWVVTAVAHLPIANRLLFRSPECELLLGQPLGPRHFLIERAAELAMPQLLWWLATGLFLFAWVDLAELGAGSLLLGLVSGLLFSALCVAYQLLIALISGHLRSRLARGLVATAAALLPLAPAASAWSADSLARWLAALDAIALWPSAAAGRIALGGMAGLVGALVLIAVTTGLAVVVDRAFLRWHRADFSAALTRSQTRRTRFWSMASGMLRVLPAPVRGLVLRDVVLLVRGAYPGAVLALVGLAAVHVLFSAAVVDPPDVRLALVMTQFFGVFEVVMVAWVFAFDWLKFRSEWLGLERSSPVAPKTLLTASIVSAVVPCLLTAASLGALAILVRPDLGERWIQLAISLGIVGVVIPALAVQAAWAGFRDRAIPEETAFGMTGGFTGMILVLATWLPLWMGIVAGIFLFPAAAGQFRRSLDCIRRLEVSW